jgi:hypothetical protein
MQEKVYLLKLGSESISEISSTEIENPALPNTYLKMGTPWAQ